MDRAAAELFSAADTVPGVKFSWSAIVLRVTRSGLRAPDLTLLGVFIDCLDETCGTASVRFYLNAAHSNTPYPLRINILGTKSVLCKPSATPFGHRKSELSPASHRILARMASYRAPTISLLCVLNIDIFA